MEAWPSDYAIYRAREEPNRRLDGQA